VETENRQGENVEFNRALSEAQKLYEQYLAVVEVSDLGLLASEGQDEVAMPPFSHVPTTLEIRTNF